MLNYGSETVLSRSQRRLPLTSESPIAAPHVQLAKPAAAVTE